MKKSVLLVILTTIITAGCVSGTDNNSANIKTCIFPGDYPDPSIMRDGKDFYMTHSSFTYYPGLLIWHSTDLLHWEPVSRAVQGQSYSIYAPDICKVNDKFYIYYPTSSGENFVVTADKIEGPWSDPIKIDVNGIDPGHAVDKNGNHKLYTNNGHMIPLTNDGLGVSGSNKKVYDGWNYPEEWETEGMWLESPKICRHGDYYYLVSAEGGTAGPATSHMCIVARSKTVIGPWENSPYNPLVHTYSSGEPWWSKGHGTLIDDVNGNWYIVYHAYRNSLHTLGRSTIIESVNWTKDGWPILTNQDGAAWDNAGLSDSLQYKMLRNYNNPLMWARWESGFEGGNLMTTTAIDASYEITASFSINNKGKAGLYLFYNEQAYIGAQGYEPLLYIRIRNEHNIVSVWKSTNGSNWTYVIENADVSTYHHNQYKGFFALRPSVYTKGDALLRSFDYKVISIN